MAARLTKLIIGGTVCNWSLNTPRSNSGTVPQGGFFMPMIRGRRAHVQGESPKARRLDCCRVFNPRTTRALNSADAPATTCNRSIAMAQTGAGGCSAPETYPSSLPSALAIFDAALSRADRVNMALDALALAADKSNRADLGAALGILSEELSSTIEQGREAWHAARHHTFGLREV